MVGKPVRQKYFISKELRFSTAIIILSSLLITTFYSYFVSLMGEQIGHGFLFFAIVLSGYVLIVFILTVIFSHRLIGPFQRLMAEIKLIVSGNYTRRLNVRENDDMYIKAFLIEVNKILDELEGVHRCRENIIKCLDSEMGSLLASVKEGDTSREQLKEAIMELREKAKEKAELK